MRLALAAILVVASLAAPAAAASISGICYPAVKHGSTMIFLRIPGSERDDAIVSVRALIAEKVQLHMTTNENGSIVMKPVPSLAVRSGVGLEMIGPVHVMLYGLRSAIALGDSVPITITFAHREPETVFVRATKAGPGMGVMSK